MKNNIVFTKDNLIVKSVGYDAEPSGGGIIYLHLDGGSIEIDVESYIGSIEMTNYSYVSDIVDNQFHYYYLNEQSTETIQEYMSDNASFDKYMDEVNESINQTS